MEGAVLFRADCGDDIGLGHVMRCFALAAALAARGRRIVLATRDPSAAALDRWRSLGAEVVALPGRLDDAAVVVDLARRRAADALVVDRYDLPPSHFEDLAAAGPRLVVVDDLGRLDPPCDLAINPNPGAETRFAAAYPRARRRLLGATYALIRPEIADAVPCGGGGVLVTLGGGDFAAKTTALARALARRLPGRRVVAVGAEPAADDRPDGPELRPRGELASLLAEADVVLCGGGVTALEATCLGRPAVVLVLADNQRPGAATLAAAGAAIVTEDSDAAVAAVADLVADASAREAMSAAGRRLVDGRGAARLAAAIEEIALHGSAVADDAERRRSAATPPAEET